MILGRTRLCFFFVRYFNRIAFRSIHNRLWLQHISSLRSTQQHSKIGPVVTWSTGLLRVRKLFLLLSVNFFFFCYLYQPFHKIYLELIYFHIYPSVSFAFLIPVSVLKNISPELYPVMLKLFNCCLKKRSAYGRCQQKNADERSCLSQYRLISILNLISKLYEFRIK